jgi:hypothetical protein
MKLLAAVKTEASLVQNAETGMIGCLIFNGCVAASQ